MQNPFKPVPLPTISDLVLESTKSFFVEDGAVTLCPETCRRTSNPDHKSMACKNSPLAIVISDFGFSRSVANNDLLKTFCESKPWVAPEVAPVGRKLSK